VKGVNLLLCYLLSESRIGGIKRLQGFNYFT
jgi:hypothetical protein